MMYNIDINRLLVQMLPLRLRTPSIFGILRAASTVLVELHKAFVEGRKKDMFRLKHNGQVCYLRGALNEAFKSNLGRFEILSIERQGKWLYAVNEAGERIIVAAPEDTTDANGIYQDDGVTIPVVSNEMSIESVPNNFVVLVPSDLYNTILPGIKALVNDYKLLTKEAIYMAQS